MTVMRKKLTKAVVLACSLTLSLVPMSVPAAPDAGQRTEAAVEESLQEGLDEDDSLDVEGAGDAEYAEGTAGSAEDTVAAEDTADDASTSEMAEGADGQEDVPNTAAADASQGRVTAEQIKAEKGGATEMTRAILDDQDDEEVMDEEENRPSYTAPEDTRHANVSFSFNEEAASAYFSKLTYPLTLGLKEVDTGSRISLTIRSEGQILEVDKGDYTVTSLKDSGKIPLSIAGDTLHIYENTEYPVRFAANSALKMFTDFLADNVFLGVFLVFAALFYQKVVIPRFASDARRR